MGERRENTTGPLLARIEAELALEALAEQMAGRPIPMAPRASGMIALLRAQPGGAAAVRQALDGDASALARLTLPERFDTLEPALAHHLALFHRQLAGELAENDSGAATDAHVASLAAWLALGLERRYLEALTAGVVRGAPADHARLAGSACAWALEELGAAARTEAQARPPRLAVALGALRRVDEACRRAGYLMAEARPWMARADAAVEAALREASTPLVSTLERCYERGEAGAETTGALRAIAEIWAWAGGRESLEVLAMDRVLPVAWEHYRESRTDELREVIAAVRPLTDRLAERVRAEPSKIAYASRCADVAVFQAELAPTQDERAGLLESALELCAAHRNARRLLASLLCQRVIDAPRGSDPSRLRAELDRAARLHPGAKRLDEARRRLAGDPKP